MLRARLILAAVVLFGTVGATPGSILFADLEGAPIPATAVGKHYCHDFDWPAIHCFRAPAALEAAVRRYLDHYEPATDDRSSAQVSGDSMAVLATKYVKVFQYATFAGSLAYLSQDYSNLHDIGWGDRISSYIVYNSASGEFYTNPGWGGAIDYFCCNQAVGSLSSTFDNQISALDMN